jgi:DNA-binding beta-propeller fold protein YncE
MNFEEVSGWGEETSEDLDVTGVAVDSHDRVYVLRPGDDPVTVLDSSGTVMGRWGNGCFSNRPHLISIGDDDKVYVTDDGGHRVYVFEPTGSLLETIGSGIPSATGFDDKRFPSTEIAFYQASGGPPFNRPTKAVPWRTGELFVSDGYRNCRVHRFSADHQQVHSWGGPGASVGCFVIPHSVALDGEGRVLVCDRENDRIQVFTRDGEFLHAWNDVQRPTDVAFDHDGNMYVTELARGPQDLKSWRLGPAKQELPGRVTIWSPDRSIIARIGYPTVNFLAPHAIAIDSTGAIYVSEVPESFANWTGRPHRPHRCLRKFEPR